MFFTVQRSTMNTFVESEILFYSNIAIFNEVGIGSPRLNPIYGDNSTMWISSSIEDWLLDWQALGMATPVFNTTKKWSNNNVLN